MLLHFLQCEGSQLSARFKLPKIFLFDFERKQSLRSFEQDMFDVQMARVG
jgi:hypothetical protein